MKTKNEASGLIDKKLGASVSKEFLDILKRLKTGTNF